MAEMLIGYARCSTDEQDLTAQRDALAGLGVSSKRIYVDHGLTGANRARPGLREALAACRAGDTTPLRTGHRDGPGNFVRDHPGVVLIDWQTRVLMIREQLAGAGSG